MAAGRERAGTHQGRGRAATAAAAAAAAAAASAAAAAAESLLPPRVPPRAPPRALPLLPLPLGGASRTHLPSLGALRIQAAELGVKDARARLRSSCGERGEVGARRGGRCGGGSLGLAAAAAAAP